MSLKKLVGKDQEIIDRYRAGENATALGRAYDCSNVSVINLLKRNGVDRRSMSDARAEYSVPHGFFDSIDTEEKAYILGLWYADGSNHEKGNAVALTLMDYDLVSRVRDILSPDRPIYEHLVGKNWAYRFQITNLALSGALARQGCGSAKTFGLTFPDLPSQLVHHFARGYFDGDGCIHRRKDSDNYVVHILGTESFLKGLSEVVSGGLFVKQRSHNKIWYGALYKKNAIVDFGRWLYSDATIWLDRKREKFPT